MPDPFTWVSEIALTRPKAGWGFGTVHKAADGRPILRVAKSHPKVACDPNKMTVTSVIASGEPDGVADVINPAGVRTHIHAVNPVVFYWHGEAGYGLPIAKSRTAKGDYGVREIGGRLLATTQFSSKDKVSSQLFRLVEDDLLSGWSIGVDPVPGTFEPLGPVNKSLGRRPMRFDETVLWEYSLTPQPVDPQAMTILVEKGRVGGETMEPLLKKSFAPFLLPSGRSVQVTKAMPYDTDPNAAGTDTLMDAAPLPPDDPTMDAGGGDGMKPTPRAFYDFAQGVLDVIDGCRNTIESGEHMEGRKDFDAFVDEVSAVMEKVKARGDELAAELAGEKADDDETEADDEMDDAADGLNTDDEGGIVTKSRYKPKRWTTADLARVTKAAEKPKKKTRVDRELERELKIFQANKKLLSGVA